MSALVWSPVYRVLEERIQSGDDLILLIVPFVKLDALKQLHWVQTSRVRLKVICRWNPEDLITGVSDLDVFTYLKAKGCELYVNPDIHLKLYVFESNVAFNTSGNLTLRGLGYSEKPNVEVGNMVPLTVDDWQRIYHIVETSRQVDDTFFEQCQTLVREHEKTGGQIPLPQWSAQSKSHTIASLPATETPEILASFYASPEHSQATPEDVRRFTHDLVGFAVPSGLSSVAFNEHLGNKFRETAFVRDFVDFLKKEKSLRFGCVNEWIHRTCEDVPLPYRWELKDNTRIFYNWLAHFYPGRITWERPRHSQIIHWHSPGEQTEP